MRGVIPPFLIRLRGTYTDNFTHTLILDHCLELFIDICQSQYTHIHIIQGVPLATEPGIPLIILPLTRILQRNLKWTYLIV